MKKCAERWRLSCCTTLGSQRLFQPGSSLRLPLALCSPCRVPRVLPWRMSHGWEQRWSYPLAEWQNGIARPSPVPAVPPARRPRGSLGSAGFPWRVPTPSHSSLRLVRCCDLGRVAQLDGIASCSARVSHRWCYSQPPLPCGSSASPPCPLALPPFVPGVASWFVSFPIALCFSPHNTSRAAQCPRLYVQSLLVLHLMVHSYVFCRQRETNQFILQNLEFSLILQP